jgi:hypothetical protein
MHHIMDELLIKQHAVSDGHATYAIKEGAQHTQSLKCRSSNLADMC